MQRKVGRGGLGFCVRTFVGEEEGGGEGRTDIILYRQGQQRTSLQTRKMVEAARTRDGETRRKDSLCFDGNVTENQAASSLSLDDGFGKNALNETVGSCAIRSVLSNDMHQARRPPLHVGGPEV